MTAVSQNRIVPENRLRKKLPPGSQNLDGRVLDRLIISTNPILVEKLRRDSSLAKLKEITSAEAKAFIAKNKFKAKIGSEVSIQYCDGDLSIKKDLVLNDKDVLLVKGSLTVGGCLFDVGAYNESDYGYLLVAGTITCQALVWGGSPLITRGGLIAKNFVYFNGWGLGQIDAGPRLKTPILMTEDSEVLAKTMEVGQVFIKDPSAWGDDAQSLTPGKIPKKLFTGKFLDVDKLKKSAGGFKLGK